MKEKFTAEITSRYSFAGDAITLGACVLSGEVVKDLYVKMPVSTANRHGLISGATGTGKTKTIQRLAESLSENGISVLLMDIKGDVSGLAAPGTENDKVKQRANLIGVEWKPSAYPVELLTISNAKGVRLRATVSEFGPVLLSKILELNENQEGVITVVFQYCDDNKLPLLDLSDLRAVLQHVIDGDTKKEVAAKYGAVSPSTVGVIMRKILEVEQQGGGLFFGEKSFDVEDLLNKSPEGKGIINILRLIDIQDRPKLFSTFMLCLLAEVYAKFPEQGDKGKPKLAIFIDEAHLIFKEASKSLLDQLETVIKLIRSKGVGIYFCTQVPTDIPDIILSQLGVKIQHALRAFTAKDRKEIKLVSENFPESEFYKTDELLTQLGIGEALVTVLDERGIPTPLAHTMICAPQSRMDILSEPEMEELIAKSRLASIYNESLDRESAYEILKKKVETIERAEQTDAAEAGNSNRKENENTGKTIKTIMGSSVTKTVVRELARGLFGMLLGKSKR